MSRTPQVFANTNAKVLTAKGRGAIAVIDISGPGAHAAVLECFQPATRIANTLIPLDEIRYGHWHGTGPVDGSPAREAVVVVARSRDCIEVHCHGGTAAVEAILHDLQQIGVSAIDSPSPLEEPDSTLHNLVISTNTRWTAALALAQQRGAMSVWAESQLTVAANADATDPRESIQANARQVLQRRQAGAHLSTPWRFVVGGPPNVGKSTLLNRLLGYQRAITFDQPGTTRDLVEAESALRGWPIRVTDTAGLRSSSDAIEAEGIKRAHRAVTEADCVLVVVDVTIGWTAVHEALVNQCRCPKVIVHNKADLRSNADTHPESHRSDEAPPVYVSAETGDGFSTLLDRVEQSIIPAELRASTYPPTTLPEDLPPIPVNPNQIQTLQRIVIARDLPDVSDALRELLLES